MFNWLKRLWHGKDSSLAEKRRSEPEGGIERKGSSKRKEAGVKPKATSKERRQSSKGKLSSKDGGSKRSRKGQQGKTNASSSQPKSVGSLKQVGRKGKGQSDKSKKQS
jgi:hypothetical protein